MDVLGCTFGFFFFGFSLEIGRITKETQVTQIYKLQLIQAYNHPIVIKIYKINAD